MPPNRATDLMEKEWVIYRITNPNGRIYVGRTANMQRRIYAYQNIGGMKGQTLIRRSIIKHGFNNHKIDIIDRFISNEAYSCCKEIFWIKTYMSYVAVYPSQKGMNLTAGGYLPAQKRIEVDTLEIITDDEILARKFKKELLIQKLIERNKKNSWAKRKCNIVI